MTDGTKTGHTPGPWYLLRDRFVTTCSHRPIAMVEKQPHDGRAHSEEYCNSLLINYSPGLLQAMRGTPNPHGGTYDNQRILTMAVCALQDEGHATLAFELGKVAEAQTAAIKMATP